MGIISRLRLISRRRPRVWKPNARLSPLHGLRRMRIRKCRKMAGFLKSLKRTICQVEDDIDPLEDSIQEDLEAAPTPRSAPGSPQHITMTDTSTGYPAIYMRPQ